eukprot:376549-Karenia_brevis.AAC.1
MSQKFGLERGNKKVSAASKSSPVAVRLQLGGSFGFGSGFVVSTHSRMCPNLTKALFEFLSRAVPTARVTSIAINDSAMTPLHTDKNNIGPSWVMSLGEFRGGGRLWVYCGTEEYKLVSTFEQLFQFNANMPHLTEPFVGRRFTITYYTDGRILERKGIEDRLAKLAQLGAPVPKICTLRKWKEEAMTHKEQNDLLRDAKPCSLEFLKQCKSKGNCPMTVCWDCRRRFPQHDSKEFCGVCDVSSVHAPYRRVKLQGHASKKSMCLGSKLRQQVKNSWKTKRKWSIIKNSSDEKDADRGEWIKKGTAHEHSSKAKEGAKKLKKTELPPSANSLCQTYHTRKKLEPKKAKKCDLGEDPIGGSQTLKRKRNKQERQASTEKSNEAENHNPSA